MSAYDKILAMPRTHTFMSVSFGCRVNEAEKIAIDRKLAAAGLTYGETDPGVIVVNSCCVTAKAEHEVRQTIHKLRRQHTGAAIVVTGCAVTRWIRDGQSLPEATLLVGNSDKAGIDRQIVNLLGDLTPTDGTAMPTDKFTRSGRIMVKIQDGCHRFCSYCIVPYVRGVPVSRKIDDIVDEIVGLGPGIAEVTLTAINTEAFGRDTGETLPQLVDAILGRTTVPRISFGSIHPWSLTGGFLDYYGAVADNPRIIPFFHVPVQSGCDSVLKRMNRQYTVEEIGAALTGIRKANPHAFIGTDVIVGFPGETDAEFRLTYAFLENAPIDRFHVFRYSPRPGTAASRMESAFPIPPSEAGKRRSELLRKLSLKKFGAFASGFTGLRMTALVLETETDGLRDALLSNNLPTGIRGCTAPAGTIAEVAVTGSDNARIIAVPA
jgi:threonylcarbamoyladenosine tRNA methylthiotransferase MtaB